MTFTCVEKCSDCCGPVPIPKEIFEKHKHLASKLIEEKIDLGDSIVLRTKRGHCAFLDKRTHKCKIYEDRPEVCRIYGIDPRFPCYYLRADGSHRPMIERRQILADMNKNVDDTIKYLKDKHKK